MAEAVVALPLVLPPTVLGFYVLVAIGPWSPLGRFYETLFGSRLPFTFGGLLFASILYSLPFAVQPLMAGFHGVDRRLIEASWTLGVSKLGTFFRVILPMSVPGLITALVLSFAHTIGEFGVVVMVGGNIQGVTRTMSIEIYDRVQALDYAAAGQTSLVSIAFFLRGFDIAVFDASSGVAGMAETLAKPWKIDLRRSSLTSKRFFPAGKPSRLRFRSRQIAIM